MKNFLISVLVGLFVLLVAVLLIYALSRRRLFHGKHEQAVYYHGSSKVIDRLDPRPSGVIDNEEAVFATDSYTDAVIFSAAWTDYNFIMGTTDGKIHLVERYPGAFDKLNAVGYIHRLPANKFHHDSRCGLDNEFISWTAVTPLGYDTVNIREYLDTADLQMVTFEEYFAQMKNKEKFLTDEQLEKVSHVYVPIDMYWDPHISGAVMFDRMPVEELDTILAKADPKSVILCGDICGISKIYDFGDVPVEIVEPEQIKYSGSDKTTEVEYMKYIEGRRKILGRYAITHLPSQKEQGSL